MTILKNIFFLFFFRTNIQAHLEDTIQCLVVS